MSLPYEDNQKDRVPYEHYLKEFAENLMGREK